MRRSSSVSFPSAALPKEYQRIGKAFQNLSSVFNSSGYQGAIAAFGDTFHAEVCSSTSWHKSDAVMKRWWHIWTPYRRVHPDGCHDGSRQDVWGNRSDGGRAGRCCSLQILCVRHVFFFNLLSKDLFFSSPFLPWHEMKKCLSLVWQRSKTKRSSSPQKSQSLFWTFFIYHIVQCSLSR